MALLQQRIGQSSQNSPVFLPYPDRVLELKPRFAGSALRKKEADDALHPRPLWAFEKVVNLADATANTASGTPRLRRVLSLWDLVLYGVVAVTPSAPVTVFGLVSVRARGHTVDTILFAMLAMVLTAISYGRMAALYPAAGSAYTYVGRDSTRIWGFWPGGPCCWITSSSPCSA